ncbi:NAD-dependent epimerase/dehydratase family protein [Yoonia sp. R2331]|uniref:NAD-dependent epimerase/dehydratase family protein n=1 Tax=Yoonia sp. R2331 TaxID=3237238 RepID=UPI0034E5BB86
MTQTVLILGASGKIGSHAADTFLNAGWQVRRYDRATGDMTAAAMGADVIVNGLNPPAYQNWAVTIPAITQQVIAAAKASGATVIIPGNIYNYGDQPGVLSENTPQTPNTRKGKIRVEMEQAYRASGVRTIVLRAGNFIDPNGNGDAMSMMLLRAIKQGKVTAMGDPDVMQTYAYVPDWARAAQMLADKRDTLPTFADIPFPGHAFSTTQLRDAIAQATGRRITMTHFPWWLMTALAPVWTLARELREMRYLFEMPHTLSADRFDTVLPDFAPTPLEQVMLCGLPADIYPDQPMRPGQKTILAK